MGLKSTWRLKFSLQTSLFKLPIVKTGVAAGIEPTNALQSVLSSMQSGKRLQTKDTEPAWLRFCTGVNRTPGLYLLSVPARLRHFEVFSLNMNHTLYDMTTACAEAGTTWGIRKDESLLGLLYLSDPLHSAVQIVTFAIILRMNMVNNAPIIW